MSTFFDRTDSLRWRLFTSAPLSLPSLTELREICIHIFTRFMGVKATTWPVILIHLDFCDLGSESSRHPGDGLSPVWTEPSHSAAWQIKALYKLLYVMGKYTPSERRLLNSAPVFCCREKCKPGTSPGLVQQQYSKLINKKTDNCLAVLLMYVPICCVSTPPAWQCRGEIVFLKQTSPAIFQLKQPAKGMICELPDIIYCPCDSYFKKWGQMVLNELPI